MPVVKPCCMKIKVVGIGDTGYRIVDKMISEPVRGVEFIAVGVKANPHKAIESAACIRMDLEHGDEIVRIISESDMVLIFAGMGDCPILDGALRLVNESKIGES